LTSEKIIKKTKKPYKLEEGSLSKFTEAALSVSGLLYHRVHLGGIPTMGANGKIFLRENPMKGYPDFDITTKAGIRSGLELKSKNGVFSKEQKEWRKKFEINNCNYRSCRTRDEVLDYIEFLGGWTGRAVYIK